MQVTYEDAGGPPAPTGLDLDVDLDALSAAELDALPFGLIQVDAQGRIRFYNRAEARLSGRDPARVLGRDFFRDVAPCTHLPFFHGRFLEGVRRGHLDERFTFVFGFEPQPVRVHVAMRAAREPGRYWIVVRALGTVAPSRQRSAALSARDVVDRRARAESVDPSVCEREPIHIPGAVQPHAVMLALDPAEAGLPVRACSDNVADVFGARPGERGSGPAVLLGRDVDALLPPALVASLRVALSEGLLEEPTRPWRRTVRLPAAGPAAPAGGALPSVPFGLSAHRHDGRVVLEFERVAERPEDFEAATPLQAQDAVSALREADALAPAAEVVAREIRAMTGFERVLVYRFDAEWNGEAVAESRSPSWEQSLLGLRFPASDIPAQARALYLRAPSRFVVDRDAVPAALMAEAPAANQTVDLTFAHSRALSPIHLEYQRNLGVNGSMSISIVVEGRLWGLVIGHHRAPHYVTPETRALAGLVADAFALRVHELESVRLWRAQQATLAAQSRLLERLAASDDFVAALTDHRDGDVTLLDLIEAGGAAVVSEGRGPVTVGVTPDAEAIRALAEWLRADLAPERRVFATDRLAEHFAPAEDFRTVASGLMAAFVGQAREHLLLWFRPEVAATVVWGGDPRKPVLADASTRTVLPRRSFERWVEELRGRADPWAEWQLAPAEALAAAIEGVVLRQGRRIAELTASEAALTRALEQKDVLAREIDHRVKNSLQIVAGVMMMQARRVSDPEAKAALEDTYARVMSVARVHDSLQHSEDVENVDLGTTLRQLCADLSVGMTDAARGLDVDAEDGLMVSSRAAVALSLIATELVTNALKYAYAPGEPGRVHVAVRARGAGGVELSVSDEGRGLPEDWEARRPRPESGGLGMRVIRAMLSQIRADMEVAPVQPRGVRFTVRA